MAQYIFTKLAEEAGVADRFEVDSAATSREELGNPVYPPARAKLAEHGIDCRGYAARQMRASDYDDFDYIIGMDQENMYYMKRLWPEDPEGTLSLLMDYTDHPREVSDPWYTRDFEATWQDVNEGCRGLLQQIR